VVDDAQVVTVDDSDDASIAFDTDQYVARNLEFKDCKLRGL
jgi:hypothetical protein